MFSQTSVCLRGGPMWPLPIVHWTSLYLLIPNMRPRYLPLPLDVEPGSLPLLYTHMGPEYLLQLPPFKLVHFRTYPYFWCCHLVGAIETHMVGKRAVCFLLESCLVLYLCSPRESKSCGTMKMHGPIPWSSFKANYRSASYQCVSSKLIQKRILSYLPK